MRLEGKKALITGASRGIGRAIARTYAREGADIAVTARTTAALAEVADEIRALGRNVHCLAWDLQDFAGVEGKLADAQRQLGGLDIVVNNAGVTGLPKGQNPTPEETYDYVMDINLKAVVLISRAAAKLMEPQRSGVIVNLSSDAGMRGAPSPYGISKWGVIGFTKGLAKEMAPQGIRVNAIAPGPVATNMMGCEDNQPKEWSAGPLGRFALPQEIADVALFLASEDSRAIFGHTIVINTANT
jgi:3-oxoacyl-[acyl-carrier protein] reductase